MRECIVYAPAKLNLYLDVLDKRPDGYHNIETLFEKIDLKDEIIIREKAKGIEVKVESAFACASGQDNIVYKALQALFKISKADLGMEVVIKKKIPVAAGLGGGSSDAASVLRSVNEAFGLGLSVKQLMSVASEIGKDVPFFMLDEGFAVATGAGDVLEPLGTDCSFSHVVVRPDISVSTAGMYKRLDDYGYRQKKNSIEKAISALLEKDLSLLKRSHYNIFEEVLADSSPHIEKAKALLSRASRGPCFLSGSGPSVFCIVKNREEAKDIAGKLPEGQGMDVFLATTFRNGLYGDRGGIYGNNRGQDFSQGRAE